MTETISAKELKTNADKYFLVDVREPDEFAEGNIPGAKNIPLGVLLSGIVLDELPKDKEIVLNCRSGRRSADAQEFLIKKGFKAINLEGGFEAYLAA